MLLLFPLKSFSGLKTFSRRIITNPSNHLFDATCTSGQTRSQGFFSPRKRPAEKSPGCEIDWWYSWFAPDVTAAMLEYRTMAKKSLWRIWLYLYAKSERLFAVVLYTNMHVRLITCAETKNQGPVSRKSRKLFGPEKPSVKLRPAHSVKLVFSHDVKGRKIKTTSKFRVLERLRFQDTKRSLSREKFRDFRETGPWELN